MFNEFARCVCRCALTEFLERLVFFESGMRNPGGQEQVLEASGPVLQGLGQTHIRGTHGQVWTMERAGARVPHGPKGSSAAALCSDVWHYNWLAG